MKAYNEPSSRPLEHRQLPFSLDIQMPGGMGQMHVAWEELSKQLCIEQCSKSRRFWQRENAEDADDFVPRSAPIFVQKIRSTRYVVGRTNVLTI